MEQIPVLQRVELPVTDLHPDPLNPNVMGERQFNALVANIKEAGFTDPILVWKRPDGVYQIIGGHHRWEAAKVLGMSHVPCTVNSDPEFSEEKAHFQLMRHNLIKGRVSAQKFVKMYERYADTYSKSQLTELFGFEEEAVLQKLIKETEKGLPKEMQKKFKDASAEIKTIDDLSKVLNALFSKYGSTLPFGYMLVDFGGKDSVWLRLHSSDRMNFEKVAQRCMDEGHSVDGVFRIVLQMLADESLPSVEAAAKLLPKVEFHQGKPPTEDHQK